MSSSYGTWVVPPTFGTVGDYSNLPSYGIGNTQTINWTTTQQDTQIWLLHDGEGFTCTQLNLGKTWCASLLTGNRGQSWNWPIQQPTNYSSSATVYYLQMRSSSLSSLFTSHYFNILPQSLLPQSSTTTSSTSTRSSSSTSTSSASTTTGTTTTTSGSSSTTSTTASITSASATSTAIADTGLSSGTKTAIGVAVGVGVPLIALLAVIAFLLYRRNNKKQPDRNHDQYQGNTPPAYKDAPEAVNNYNKPPEQYAHGVHEMPPSQPQHQYQRPQEMASNNYPSYQNTPSELSGNAYSPR
ncbi:hypothetical protein H2198_001192 [Neophaeococcomyces mojaviensis]|uniref:Uncharacterized protein n=1 Tax=Neophaeococcomyces mojaviensis TaxID=3383035 RepID=A0ACC3AI64_9EURO|nr:hypothetical protein H2198_001192 [Knufia sp. JES_112]